MTTRTETGSYGLLGSLSPQMARELGDAFSLERIGARRAPLAGESEGEPRATLKFARVAARVAVLLVAAAVGVSVSTAAMYLMHL